MQIHEFSYQHDPSKVIPKQANEILRIGSAKKSTTVLKDMALNNDATIHGAMSTGDGFFTGGRRYDGVDNYLKISDSPSLSDTNNITLEGLVNFSNVSSSITLIRKGSEAGADITWLWYYIGSTNRLSFYSSSGESYCIFNPTINTDYHITTIINSTGNVQFYINGVLQTNLLDNVITWVDDASPLLIGKWAMYQFGGIIKLVAMHSGVLDASRFNTLAVLPFYRHVFTDYTNNTTSLTTIFPGSSGIINSGSFNRTDGLKCTSAGTIVFSAANKFDGAEYIKVKIGGVWYAGTGTITQGTVTVAVSQGSNDITMSMGTNDIVQEILINFRAEV